MNHTEARNLAELLILDLHPAWVRIEIAGSLRRGKRDPKDIELVAIPIIEIEPLVDLFDHIVEVSLMDRLQHRLQELLEPSTGWAWELDGELPRNGPRYKRLRHRARGLCCDLFLTTERGWGGAMAIRTGPADFSRALVTLARRQGKHAADGYLIHGHPKPRRQFSGFDDREEEYPCPKGESCPLIIPTLEEIGFLAALGLPWIEPAERRPDLIWKNLKMETI